MKPLDSTEFDWADERIEAYVDGELDAAERRRFETLMAHANVSDRVDSARSIQSELRGLPRETCPDRVVEAVLTATTRSGLDEFTAREDRARAPVGVASRNGRPPRGKRTPGSGPSAVRTKWTPPVRAVRSAARYAAAAAVALLTVFMWSRLDGPDNRPVDPGDHPQEVRALAGDAPSATPEEVARAVEEARWALRYVSDLGRSTGRPVRHVVQKHVAVPVRDAVSHMLHDGAARPTDGEVIQQQP